METQPETTINDAILRITEVLKKHSIRSKSKSAMLIWFNFQNDPQRDIVKEVNDAGDTDNWVYNEAQMFLKDNPWTVEGKQNPPMMLAYRYIKKFGGETK